MADCPGCLGDGHLDQRNLDAWFGEHYTDAELEYLCRERGLVHPVGIVTCEECEGTGVVSQERHDEMFAASYRHVLEIIDRFKAIDGLEEAFNR